jgi:hypothetical protein
MNHIESHLQQLQESGTHIELQLWPPTGSTTIQKHGNRLRINEGRQGKFENVSEAHYDQLVSKYDSRHRYED